MRQRPWRSAFIMSLATMFAVLNVMSDFFPISPVLGFTQSKLTLGWVFAPLTGIMLGPIIGSMSCLLAAIVGLFLGFPTLIPFGPAGLIRSALSALQAGLISSGHWKVSTSLLALLVLSWLFVPTGQEAVPVLVFHLLALLLMVVLRNRIVKGLDSPNRATVGLTVAIIVYCGNISRHLYGNLLFAVIVHMPALIFVASIPLTFLEQTFFSVVSSVLGMYLIRLGLRKVTFSR